MKAGYDWVNANGVLRKSAFLIFLSVRLRKSLFWSNSKQRKAVKMVIATATQQEQLVKARWRLESK
jgi:hypothetical protein